VGNVGADSNSWGWAFRGQRILEAILDTLSTPVTVVVETRIHFLNHTHEDVNTTYTTLPLAAGHRLLFSGCSAGARGAMFNVDYISSFMPPGVEIRALFDSPLWVDVQPLEANITSLENETQAIFGLVNATARIPAACAATYPGDEGWKCLFGQYRVPFTRTPYLISASQFDLFQLPYNEGALPPPHGLYAGASLAYADAFQRAVRAVVLDLPTAAQAGSAVYSSACFKHCVTMIGSFWGVRINGMNLKDYLALWYFGSTDPATHVNPALGGAASTGLPAGTSDQRIEACLGFGCGECHSKHAAPAPPLPPAYATSLLPGTSAAGPGAARSHASRRDVEVMGAAAVLSVALAAACLLARQAGGGGGGGSSSSAAARSATRTASSEMTPLVRKWPIKK
jgi:hypothetical protein